MLSATVPITGGGSLGSALGSTTFDMMIGASVVHDRGIVDYEEIR